MIRAEDVYTALLRDDADNVRPGARRRVTCTFTGRDVTADWEIRPNAVWRQGRVFLKCPRCGRRTRGCTCRWRTPGWPAVDVGGLRTTPEPFWTTRTRDGEQSEQPRM